MSELKLRFLKREGYHKSFLPSRLQSWCDSTLTRIKISSINEGKGENRIIYGQVYQHEILALFKATYTQFNKTHLQKLEIILNNKDDTGIVKYTCRDTNKSPFLYDCAIKEYLPLDINSIIRVYEYYHSLNDHDLEKFDQLLQRCVFNSAVGLTKRAYLI